VLNTNQNIVLKAINTEIKEYGKYLSFGCSQLLCVARAILRKSKIITNVADNIFKDSTAII